MIKLTVAPQVLTKLRKAHPTPAASAARLLTKYVGLLEELVNDALKVERSGFMRKKDIYSVNVSKLHRCGQFGNQRTRLHKWLEDNDLALIKIVERGNNIKSVYSWVQLTKLVTLVDDMPQADALMGLTDAAIGTYLGGDEKAEAALYRKLYPDLDNEITEAQVAAKFDAVPVDQQSLQNYITWLLTDATLIGESRRELYVGQARDILSISKQLNGIYLQRKKRSEFGRVYYEGSSLQNVNKELRRAMLGDCWEYDVRSSVVAWKMSFAKEFLQNVGATQGVRKVFAATLWFLESKAEFMQQVQDYTFTGNSNVSAELQTKLIKRAMTALCFGARLTAHGWRTSEDGWQNPALAKILMNETERKRFMVCQDVRNFVREQNALDTYIYKSVEAQAKHLLQLPILRANKRPSKAKVIAYLYQNAETQSMTQAYEYLQGKKIPVLGKIHDAFVVRDRLTDSMKQELEQVVQLAMYNEYWRLGEKQLKRWGDVLSQDEKLRIEQHQAFMAQELEYMRDKALQLKQ